MIEQHGWLELSRSRLLHNISLIRARLGGRKLCATIKANAYGHGAAEICAMIPDGVVDFFCVYSVEEAMAIAGSLRGVPLLVLAPWVAGGPSSEEAQARAGAAIRALGPTTRFTLMDSTSAQVLGDLAQKEIPGAVASVHVQVDTGLTRSGVFRAELAALVETIDRHPGLNLEGIFMHPSHGDCPDHAATKLQVDMFMEAVAPIAANRPEIVLHAHNSGGVLYYALDGLHMARIGIAMYGLQASSGWAIEDLRPIAKMCAGVIAIHDRPAGVGVGYGHTFVTTRKSRLALIPVGYADGYPRALSNRGTVKIGGQDAPVVGRVSMDQMVVDVTDLPRVLPGDIATVMSDDPKAKNSVDAIAAATGTIGYEIATGFGARLERRWSAAF